MDRHRNRLPQAARPAGLEPRHLLAALLYGQDNDAARLFADEAGNDGAVDYFSGSTALRTYHVGVYGNNHVTSTLDLAKGRTVSLGMQLNRYYQELAQFYEQFLEDQQASDSHSLVDMINGLAKQGNQTAADLKDLAAVLKEHSQVSIQLRPGYEVDGPWNGQDPETFKKAFRLISLFLKDKQVGHHLQNVEMVLQYAADVYRSATPFDGWQGSTNPTAQDARKHLIEWDPGSEYWDQIGLTILQSDQAVQLWQSSVNDNARISDIRKLAWDPIIAYAKEKGKKVQISELSPQGAFGNLQAFNMLVETHLQSLSPKEQASTKVRPIVEGEVPVIPPFVDNVDIRHFFDGDEGKDPTPEIKIISDQQVLDSFFADVTSFISDNRDRISSINAVVYNWEDYPGWEAILELDGASTLTNEGAWGNGWHSSWLQAIQDVA